MSNRALQLAAALAVAAAGNGAPAQPVAPWALRCEGIPGVSEVPVDALVLNPVTQWWEWSLPPGNYFDTDGNLLLSVEQLRIAYSMWGEFEVEFSILAGIDGASIFLWSGESRVPTGMVDTSFECVLSNRSSPTAELTPTLRDWQTGEYFCWRAIEFYDTAWAHLVQAASTETELHIYEHAGPYDVGLDYIDIMSMCGLGLSAGDHLYAHGLHVLPEPAPAAMLALLATALARRRG